MAGNYIALLDPHTLSESGSETLQDAASAQFVAFGEVHETPWAVRLAASLLRVVCEHGRLGWVGFEYFNIEQQALLDSWIQGSIGWSRLVEEYSEGPEGFNLEVYRPLLEQARACTSRLVALMPPRPVANSVAKSGQLPRGYPLEAEPQPEAWARYREELEPLFPRVGPMARIPLDRLILAQSFKDSVAATVAARALTRWGRGFIVMGWAHVELPGAVVARALALSGLRESSAAVVSARRGGIEEARRDLRHAARPPFHLAVAIGP